MKALYDLKDKLCAELDEIAAKPNMSTGDLETVQIGRASCRERV